MSRSTPKRATTGPIRKLNQAEDQSRDVVSNTVLSTKKASSDLRAVPSTAVWKVETGSSEMQARLGIEPTNQQSTLKRLLGIVKSASLRGNSGSTRIQVGQPSRPSLYGCRSSTFNPNTFSCILIKLCMRLLNRATVRKAFEQTPKSYTISNVPGGWSTATKHAKCFKGPRTSLERNVVRCF